MRIAHISDLHICTESFPENIYKTRQLFNAVVESEADHLVVTGDITHDAKTEDLHRFRNILSEYGFLNADKTSLVIGNHDIYGGVHLASDIINFPKRCRSIKINEKVALFRDQFDETFDNTIFLQADNTFPYVKLTGNVMLVGLNSVTDYSLIRNSAASNGKISSADYNLLRDFFETNRRYDDYTKIVLIHHHFTANTNVTPERQNVLFEFIEYQTMKLRGSRKLLKLFARHNINLVLHGHVHFNKIYNRNSLRFLGGGGAVKDDRDNRMKLNLIDINPDEIEIQIKSIGEGYVPELNPQPGPIYTPRFAG